MKKVLTLVGVLALVAACDSTKFDYDSVFPECSRIETTKQHIVYQCSTELDWVPSTQTMEANGKFKSAGNLNLAELYADPDYKYIEIALHEPSCQNDFSLRIMVAEPNADTDWAHVTCLRTHQ